MLIVALILAVIGLAALVTAVVTSNDLIAWVCIGASGIGVLLLVIDAVRERSRRARLPVAAATEVIEPVETTEVIEPVETTEVIEPVETTEVIEPVVAEDGEVADENDSAADDFADDAQDDEAELSAEEHPDELVHDEPDYDMPSDDEADYPEPAEEAAIHTVDEDELDEDQAGEPESDEYTAEVHYVSAAEGNADTVVYIHAEERREH